MATKSSCQLTSFTSKTHLPNDTTTNLIKTLTCYGRQETFCESGSSNLIDFCTPSGIGYKSLECIDLIQSVEVKCGNDESTINRTIPVSNCHCLGFETCFCSFGCSVSVLVLTLYIAFFVYAQFFKKEDSKFLNIFCIRRNFLKTFAKIPGESLTCLDWLRAISLMSVVVGHFHQILSKVHTESNDKHSFFSMFLLHNMSLSVDTFLLLGGLLHAYTWILKVKAGRHPKINLTFWVRFIFQRWYRLAPSLITTIFISNVLGNVILPELWMGSGMLYKTSDPKGDCSATWLTMITFTNNIFPNTCMRWLWYLAMDVQLNFMAVFFLLALDYISYKKIFGISLCVLVASLVYRGYLASVLNIEIMYLADAPVWEYPMQNIYVRAFPRLSPYLIGLLLGARLDDAVDFVGNTKKIVHITVLSFVFLLYAHFGGFYEYFLDVDSFHRVIYLAVFRTVFTLSIAWYALMCTSRHVAFFKILRKFWLWQPVARLSYSAYLIHPLVIGTLLQTVFHSYVPFKQTIDYTVLCGGLLGVGVVLLCALCFTVVFEQPFAGMRPMIEPVVLGVFSFKTHQLDQKKNA